MFTSFLFNYKVCGGNFTSPQGSFDYLFYGTEQGYPDDQECHWTITAEPCKVCIHHASWNTETQISLYISAHFDNVFAGRSVCSK